MKVNVLDHVIRQAFTLCDAELKVALLESARDTQQTWLSISSAVPVDSPGQKASMANASAQVDRLIYIFGGGGVVQDVPIPRAGSYYHRAARVIVGAHERAASEFKRHLRLIAFLGDMQEKAKESEAANYLIEVIEREEEHDRGMAHWNEMVSSGKWTCDEEGNTYDENGVPVDPWNQPEA